jgi:hypothetical protein
MYEYEREEHVITYRSGKLFYNNFQILPEDLVKKIKFMAMKYQIFKVNKNFIINFIKNPNKPGDETRQISYTTSEHPNELTKEEETITLTHQDLFLIYNLLKQDKDSNKTELIDMLKSILEYTHYSLCL